MRPAFPADELAEIRAEIARLRAREAALRAVFVNNPDQNCLGRWTRVEVVEQRERRFNAALLPPEMLCDPRFHETRVWQSVRCVAASITTTLRPGWPINRAGFGLH
jgi:hypothetical protein